MVRLLIKSTAEKLMPSIKIIVRDNLLPWISAAAAGLIAICALLQSQGVINNDGLLYIEAAKKFSMQEWQQGLALYNWPFYSLTIAGVHVLTGWTHQLSAHVLTLAFFMLTAAGLVILVKELGGDRRVMLCMLILLLSSPYIVRSLLPMVIRDHGFLTLHIWSVIFFVRFFRNPSYKSAIGWSAAAIAATLFRIEGIIYLAFLPLVLLADTTTSWQNRCVRLLKAQALPLLLACLLILGLGISTSWSASDLGRLGDPIAILNRTLMQLTHGLFSKAELYGSHVLGPFLDNFAFSGLLATLIIVLLTKIALSAGATQFLLAVLPIRISEYKGPQFQKVLLWLALIGVCNAIMTLIGVFVLSTRYLLPLAILILMLGAFGFASLSTANSHKWKWKLVILAVTLQFISNFWPHHASHGYEIEAAQWIKNNIAQEKRIFFDEGRLRYYAYDDSSDRTEKRWPDVQQILTSSSHYDYVVVHASSTNADQHEYLKAKYGKPLVSFGNPKRKQLLIFATRPSTAEGLPE